MTQMSPLLKLIIVGGIAVVVIIGIVIGTLVGVGVIGKQTTVNPTTRNFDYFVTTQTSGSCGAGSWRSKSLTSVTGAPIQGVCRPCPAGTYSNSVEASSCISCPIGTFSAFTSSTSCDPCPNGESSQLLGAFSSQLCGTPLFAVGPSSAPSSTSAPTTPSVYTGVGTCNAAYNTTCSALQLSQGYCVGSSGTCGLDVAGLTQVFCTASSLFSNGCLYLTTTTLAPTTTLPPPCNIAYANTCTPLQLSQGYCVDRLGYCGTDVGLLVPHYCSPNPLWTNTCVAPTTAAPTTTVAPTTTAAPVACNIALPCPVNFLVGCVGGFCQ